MLGDRGVSASLLLCLAAAAATVSPAQAERRAPVKPVPAESAASIPPVSVTVDHAKVIRLPDRTQTVIVGNPMIADVTVQQNGILIVTGKSFGVTNLIALDGAGALLAESSVRVQAAGDSVVVVQRGLERESYSCTPNCQPSLQLGDSQNYFDRVGGQTTRRNQLSTEQR